MPMYKLLLLSASSSPIKKNYKTQQKATPPKTPQFEETEQASAPDMAETLRLSGWEYKIALVNIIRALMHKVDRWAT